MRRFVALARLAAKALERAAKAPGDDVKDRQDGGDNHPLKLGS